METIVDDTFVMMQINAVNRFFDHLNNLDSNINFTVNQKQDDKLAFSDVLVMRTQDGKLTTSIQKNNPHQSIFEFPFSSNQSTKTRCYGEFIQLSKMAYYQINRLDKRKKFLSHILTENEYPKWFIQKALKKQKLKLS